MSFSVSHLPDVCLLHIFARIPLSDLIRSVGRVCTNWDRIQREEFGRRRTSTRTLVLFQNSFVDSDSSSEKSQNDFESDEEVDADKEGDSESDSNSDSDKLKHENTLRFLQAQETPYLSNLISYVRRDEDESPWTQLRSLEQINFNILEFPDHALTERFTSRLMDIFPNITHLTLAQNDEDVDNANLDQLIRLIQHYSNSLITLKLDLAYGDANDCLQGSHEFEPHVAALFDSIDQLESLQHLTLNVSFPPFMQINGELTILSQLTTFTSHKFQPKRYLSPLLSELVFENVQLDCKIDDMNLQKLSELDPRVLSKFVRLSICKHQNMLCLEHFDRLHLLCSRLTSITTLELFSDRMPMTMLARCLVQLPGLIHLNVTFYIEFKYSRIPLEGDEEKEGEEKEDKPKPVIVPLPSVRLLTLGITTKSHLDAERLHIPEIFPNLQVLHLVHTSKECDECGFDYNRVYKSEMHSQIANCMRLARQQFWRCAKLHTIKLETDKLYESCIPRDLITRDQL